MNRERAKELLPIIQAYADGKDIEYKSDCFPSKWVCVNDLMGEIGETSGQYRIKPEPRVFWIRFYNTPGVHPDALTSLEKAKEVHPANAWGGTKEIIKVREVLDDD